MITVPKLRGGTLKSSHLKVLAIICRYIDRTGYSPTLTEIAKQYPTGIGWIVPVVHQLDGLGFLTTDSFKARTVRPTYRFFLFEEAITGVPTAAADPPRFVPDSSSSSGS